MDVSVNPSSSSAPQSCLSPRPPILIPEPTPPRPPSPSHFTCLPVLLVLDKWGFCLPWHPSVFIFWREGQKEDEGLEVCGEKFLEDVPGLCSQGTSCSQCERGTLSMRSISMTIIFILQQSGSRQHSAGGGRGAFPPIRYTPCNILAVHTNKSREREDSESIVNLRQTLQNSRFCACPVELSSVRALNLRLRTSPDRTLLPPLLSVAANATSDGSVKYAVLDR